MTLDFMWELLASLLTCVGIYRMGALKQDGPLWNIASQIPWAVIIYTREQWGLIPLNVVLTIIFIGAAWKWRNGVRI